MSFENGGNNSRLNTENTVYVVNQGNVNQGFRPDHPETPPPKYEDVISGEYLKRMDITYVHPPPTTAAITSVTCDFNNPHIDITQPVPASEDQNEECKCVRVWQAVVIIVVILFVFAKGCDIIFFTKQECTPNKSSVCNGNSPGFTFYSKSPSSPPTTMIRGEKSQ